MDIETLVAVFDTKDHATAAVNALKAGGFHSDDIDIIDSSSLAAGKGATATDPKQAGLWQRLHEVGVLPAEPEEAAGDRQNTRASFHDRT